MSTPKKKIGDRVMITAGQNKDKVGAIVDKERRGCTTSRLYSTCVIWCPISILMQFHQLLDLYYELCLRFSSGNPAAQRLRHRQ
ncbi:KOW motif-containing protein [bacterium]|nr:KOW motif-containing protein [bacterium]